MGITFSSPEDLKRWGADTGYDGVLLSDPNRAVAITYGAASSSDQEKATRISILVDSDGVVLKTYEVKDAADHATESSYVFITEELAGSVIAKSG